MDEIGWPGAIASTSPPLKALISDASAS